MNPTLLEGIVSNLDRTTQVSGGEMTSTTHLSIFSLAGERVLLLTRMPAMIEDGDHLRVAGQSGQGQFTAIACRNLTTGWSTSPHKQGCAKSALIAFTVIGLIFTWLSFLFVFFPLVNGVILFRLIKAESRMKSAHAMLHQS